MENLTPREAFKLGFLQSCADIGLTPEQTQGRIKQAIDMLEKRAGPGLSDIVKMIKKRINTQGNKAQLSPAAAIGLGVTGTAAAGIGAGWLARKLRGDFLDPDDVKKQELINQYRTLTGRANSGQAALGM